MKKVLEGVVISTKMQNTAVIEVGRTIVHPLYRKRLKRTKNYKADTLGIGVEVGNVVQIKKTRPISKDKHFKVVKILDKKNASPVSIETVSKPSELEKSRESAIEEKVIKKRTRKNTKEKEK